MYRLLKITLASLLLACSLQFALPVVAHAAVSDVCEGINLGASCDAPADTPSIDSTIAVVVNILSLVVGVVAVIIIIVGGLRYITSLGDPTSTKNARNTIMYAIVGLIIVALAQAIVRFVLHKAATVTPAPAAGIVTTKW